MVTQDFQSVFLVGRTLQCVCEIMWGVMGALVRVQAKPPRQVAVLRLPALILGIGGLHCHRSTHSPMAPMVNVQIQQTWWMLSRFNIRSPHICLPKPCALESVRTLNMLAQWAFDLDSEFQFQAMLIGQRSNHKCRGKVRALCIKFAPPMVRCFWFCFSQTHRILSFHSPVKPCFWFFWHDGFP